MKATVKITFKDGTHQNCFDGDFWSHQFKCDLEDRNNAFIKIGDNYIRKDDIRSATAFIEKTEGETK
jgi:hypothetical protein